MIDESSWGPREEKYFSCRLLSLKSPAVLKQAPKIAQLITYLADAADTVHFSRNAGREGELGKQLHLVFERTRLHSHHSDVKAELESVLSLIEKETALITEDNLAEGKLVELVGIYARLQKDEAFTFANTDPLYSPVGEDDPPEWLGRQYITLGTASFISDSDRFPWMPTDVAQWVGFGA